MSAVAECKACKGKIEGECVTALGGSWHFEHFTCGFCSKVIPPQVSFHPFQDRPICAPCFAEKLAPKCARCAQPIVDQALDALEGKWHQKCFTCEIGGHVIPHGQPFHAVAGPKLYCPDHYDAHVLEKCSICTKPLKGALFTVGGKSIHEACYKCSKCSTQLNESNGGVDNGVFICHTCHAKK